MSTSPESYPDIKHLDDARSRVAAGGSTLKQSSLSKSRYLAGLQCTKRIWHLHNDPAALPPPDDATQGIFDQGTKVGLLARTLFPNGFLVDCTGDHQDAQADTHGALRHRQPVFEATLIYQGASCRVDILAPAGRDRWDLVEVKSTTSVKDTHLHDLAFQAHVLTGAGVKLRRYILMHVNPDYVRHGDLDPAQLFRQIDVTAQVQALLRDIEDKLDDLARVVRQPTTPEVPIGRHCDDPYDCPMKDQCWALLPEHSVFTLYRGGERSWTLFAGNVHKIDEIPDEYDLSDKQMIQRTALRSGRPHVDGPAIRAFLSRITYPAYYLDFETIGPAVPLYEGTSPYDQTPFQFSLHIQRSANAEPEHRSFLAEGAEDPRHELMQCLSGLIGREGSVIAYNASFELRVLRECCGLHPEFQAWLDSVEPRIIDLLEPFRAFHFYHPDQRGSASMKKVLPALTGHGYDDLAIGDGGTASREFMRVTFGEVDEAERVRVRRELETYCALDTRGMVDIVQELRGLTL